MRRHWSSDRGIARHVDAIQVILRPDRVVAILVIEPEGWPYFICPPANDAVLRFVLGQSFTLGRDEPTST